MAISPCSSYLVFLVLLFGILLAILPSVARSYDADALSCLTRRGPLIRGIKEQFL